jgi:hypothetical protein
MGSERVWHEPGDVRTEAFVQASVSFEWPNAIKGRQNRIGEWFHPSVPVEQVITRLAEVYRRVPPDLLS